MFGIYKYMYSYLWKFFNLVFIIFWVFLLHTCNQKWIAAITRLQLADLLDKITLNSTYNEVAFNKKSAIMKENLCTKYTPFTYKYIVLNENPPITKQNLYIFFFCYRWSWVYMRLWTSQTVGRQAWLRWNNSDTWLINIS